MSVSRLPVHAIHPTAAGGLGHNSTLRLRWAVAAFVVPAVFAGVIGLQGTAEAATTGGGICSGVVNQLAHRGAVQENLLKAAAKKNADLIASLKADRSRMDGVASTLTAQLDQVNQQIADLEAEETRLTTDLQNAEDRLAELTRTQSATRQAIEDATSNCPACGRRWRPPGRSSRPCRLSLPRWRPSAAALTQQKHDIEQQLDAKQEQIAAATADLTGLQQDADAAAAALQAKTQQVSTAEGELADLQHKADAAAGAVAAAENAVAAAQAELTRLEAEGDAAQAALDAKQAELAAARDDLGSARQAATDAAAAVTAKQAEISGAEADLATCKTPPPTPRPRCRRSRPTSPRPKPSDRAAVRRRLRGSAVSDNIRAQALLGQAIYTLQQQLTGLNGQVLAKAADWPRRRPTWPRWRRRRPACRAEIAALQARIETEFPPNSNSNKKRELTPSGTSYR